MIHLTQFGSHQHDRNSGGIMSEFRNPLAAIEPAACQIDQAGQKMTEVVEKCGEERKQNLFGDVLITGPADEGKGQQKHICSSVAQGP